MRQLHTWQEGEDIRLYSAKMKEGRTTCRSGRPPFFILEAQLPMSHALNLYNNDFKFFRKCNVRDFFPLHLN